jgi:hypothetical protein
MFIDLPDLGEAYSVKAVNDGNSFSTEAGQRSFAVSPGTYLLVKKGIQSKIKPADPFKNITVKEFAAPKASLKETIVRHQPLESIAAGAGYEIDASVYSADTIQTVELFASAPGSRMERIPMERASGYNYRGTIPPKFSKQGNLRYHIVVKQNNLNYSYPSGLQTHPWDWDFYDRVPYETAVVPDTDPVFLFNAVSDADELMRPWLRNSAVVPGADGSAELRINIEKLFTTDPENRNAARVSDYSLRFFTGTKTIGRKNDGLTSKKIVFRGRSLTGKPCKVQVALVTKNGDAFGGMLTVGNERTDYSFTIAALRPVKLVSLPRPYPTFLSYYVADGSAAEFNLNDLEGLQISIGPGMTEEELKEPHGIAIESVRLE